MAREICQCHFRSRLMIFFPKWVDAFTFGRHIFFRYTKLHWDNRPDAFRKLLEHEKVHVEQYERNGVFQFLVKYVWFSIRKGYRNNPFEIEARELSEKRLAESE